jgi:hypothetical protein
MSDGRRFFEGTDFKARRIARQSSERLGGKQEGTMRWRTNSAAARTNNSRRPASRAIKAEVHLGAAGRTSRSRLANRAIRAVRAVHHLKAAHANSTPSQANRATKAAERFSISMRVEVRPPRFGFLALSRNVDESSAGFAAAEHLADGAVSP